MGRDISFILLTEVKEKDALGQMVPSGQPIKRKCIGSQKSVSQSEFFKASQVGFEAEGVIEMNPVEYKGEALILIGGQEFTIYRTYEKDTDKIEVYYGKRVGNQNG